VSRVTVIVPFLNRAGTLPRCIASIRAQTFGDWELIAVDDGSTDDSVAVIEAIADPRIRIIRHERNRGAGAARNTGLRAATGELIAFLDSDDEWLPQKLERQIPAIESSGAGLVLCGFEEITDGVAEIHLPPGDADWKTRLHWICGVRGGTTPLFRRSCLERVGFMDEEIFPLEDWDWLLRFAQAFPFAVVPEVLARAYSGGARNPELVAKYTTRFLELHDNDFRAVSASHRGRVRAKHFEGVAANAFEARRFSMGSRFLVRSFLANPVQNPLRLAALLLAPIDALLGTSLITRGAALQRRLLQRSPQA
jgi:glycosyltransferase involved in cell wall biosynthesis